MGSESGENQDLTPGPWYAYFSVHGDPFVISDEERPYFSEVAKVSTSTEDYGRANTLLIAAAPEMLSLLKRVGRRCPYFGHSDPASSEKRIRHDCADDQCRNPAHVTYSECSHVWHDIAALLDHLDTGHSGRTE